MSIRTARTAALVDQRTARRARPAVGSAGHFYGRIERLESRTLLTAAGTLFSADFDAGPPANAPRTTTVNGGSVLLERTNVGTVDTEGSNTKSNAYRLTETRPGGSAAYSASLEFGPVALGGKNNVDGKLHTLGFDLASSTGAPVQVLISSHDTATGAATGTISQVVYPATPNTLEHFSVDTATATPVSGTFNGKSGYVSFTFVADSANLTWPTYSTGDAKVSFTVDNLNYAKPSYYVNPGNFAGLGGETTETPAYSTIQAAVNAAAAANDGGIIAIRSAPASANYNYTERDSQDGMVDVHNGGTKTNWLSLKAYPGEKPQLDLSTARNSYNAIRIGNGSSGAISSAPAVAYVEVRGLTVFGNDRDDLTDTSVYARSGTARNTNGISVFGDFATNHPHDIRLADNLVKYCSGAGLGISESDRVEIVGNTAAYNCKYTKYGTSGISLLSAYNFEGYTTPAAGTFNPTSRILRNNIAFNNECTQLYGNNNFISDGNGIIVDINHNTAGLPNGTALGRTLVENNLSYLNGGGGVHIYRADYVDVFNNTSYLNSRGPQTKYGQIDATSRGDLGDAPLSSLRIYSNILIGPDTSEHVRGGTPAAYLPFFKNNIYFGGDTSTLPVTAGNDEILITNASQFYTSGTTTPLFRNVTTNNVAAAQTAISSLNFNLGNGSIAINNIRDDQQPFTPYGDGLDRLRTFHRDVGAYEYAYYVS